MVYVIMIMITIPLAYIWELKFLGQNFGEGFVLANKYVIRPSGNFWGGIAFLPLYFVYALQYSLHSDYDNYNQTFINIKYGNGTIRELAVYWINKIIAELNLDFQIVYLIIYAIAFLILAKCILNYSKDFALSMVTFITIFFTLNFLQIRQLVAVLICLYAYRFVTEYNFIKYSMCVLAACMFHVSALIMLPAYFVLSRNFKLSYYLVISGIFAFLNLFRERIIVFFLTTFLPGYLGRHEMFRSFEMNKWDLIFVLYSLFLCGIFYQRIKNTNKSNSVFLNAVFIYFILFFFGRWIFEFDRFGYYFFIPIICLLPNMIECEKNKDFRYFLKILSFALMIVLFVLKHGNEAVFQYVSILQVL